MAFGRTIRFRVPVPVPVRHASSPTPRPVRHATYLAIVTAVAAPSLLAACGSNGRQADDAADLTRNASVDGPVNGSAGLGHAVVDLSRIQGTGGAGAASPAQRQWLAQATAFLDRPEQQRDVQSALRARASTHPAFCPRASFVPKRIDIASDPEPRFAADGMMTRGTVVYRATMQGCSTPVLLTVYVDAMPDMPLRFRAGLAGTTFADPDLQERAIPHATAAAQALLPGCARMTPIDTRLIGASPSASGSLVPWSEFWLVSGCGRLVSTRLDFTPDRATNRMLVRADPGASRLVRTGAAMAPATGGPMDELSGGSRPSASPTDPSGKVVASATGTSRIPADGAEIPAAKVAGTCLFRLRETAPATAPTAVECLSGLSPRAGATTQCTASRGQARGQMVVTVTDVDGTGGSVNVLCSVRAR